MTYVMSDMHGYMGRFMVMLKKINFLDSDELYVIGDVIDRGPNGIEIIKYIMAHPNIHFIMGNHEHMLLTYIEKNPIYRPPYTDSYMKQLIGHNGGDDTLSDYTALSPDEKNKIHTFLKNSPYTTSIIVNGKSFYMVHGCPIPEEEKEYGIDEYNFNCVWERPPMTKYHILDNGPTVIIGHTPTMRYTGDADKRKIFRFQTSDDPNAESKMIDVDCGMSSPYPQYRTLGCLCLDTMEEFYV